MKKLFFFGAFALISLAACQNETTENLKVQASDEGVLKAASAAMPNSLSKEGSVIHCHTNYLSNTGHACVSNGGYLFEVSWTNIVSTSHQQYVIMPEPIYTATQVSSCGC